MNKDYFVFLGEIGAKLGASSATTEYAFKILRLAREQRVTSGRNPHVLAAVALYVAKFAGLGPWSERWTQKEVAIAADVCEPTVRKVYHLFLRKLGLTLPNGVPAKG